MSDMECITWHRAGDTSHAIAGREYAGAAFRAGGEYDVSLCYRATVAGFKDKRFPTRSEAEEYIEACYTLWVAGGRV